MFGWQNSYTHSYLCITYRDKYRNALSSKIIGWKIEINKFKILFLPGSECSTTNFPMKTNFPHNLFPNEYSEIIWRGYSWTWLLISKDFLQSLSKPINLTGNQYDPENLFVLFCCLLCNRGNLILWVNSLLATFPYQQDDKFIFWGFICKLIIIAK